MNKLREGYIKIQYDLAPKTDGKKFAEWCEKYGFTPLNGGRRAWNSQLSTYLRGASGVAFADGEMFLFDEEDLVDLSGYISKVDVLEAINRGQFLDPSKHTSEILDTFRHQIKTTLKLDSKEKQ